MNLIQLSIVLETLGVLFISFDIIFSRHRRKKLNENLIRWLKSGSQPKRAIVATFLCLLSIIAWAVVTDWQSNTPTQVGPSILSILSMLFGVVGGITVPIFMSQVITLILTKIKSKFGFSKEIDTPLIIYVVTLITCVLGLVLFSWATKVSIIFLLPFLLTFILTSIFLSAWINLVPLLQRWLAFDKNPVSKFGILMFLIAKLIQYNIM